MTPKKKKSTAKKNTKAKSSKPKRQSATKKKVLSWKQKLFRWLLKWSLIGGSLAAGLVVLLVLYYLRDIPDVSRLNEQHRTPQVTLYTHKGEEIISFGQKRGDRLVYSDLPDVLIDAVIATEDRRFFDHFGVDIWGLLRAAYANYKAGSVVQGGSTISQQLAKVMFLNPERTLKRKVQEAVLALYLESNFSKEEILSMYLNRIYMGAGNYGVDAASKYYFDKNISDINVFEAAMLAGLIQAPSRYAPSQNPELAQKRARSVLNKMVDNGVLTTETLLDLDLGSRFQYRDTNRGRYGYFSDWVRDTMPDYIGEVNEDIDVYTTLDADIQTAAEAVVQEHILAVREKQPGVQAAVVVMNPKGAVLGMVGGVAYQESQFNRAVQALRQPGSAFKLFVYLAALEAGFKPDDTLVDEEITINKWQPRNWNERYIGEVSLKDALAFSINTIAVKLAHSVGMENIKVMARELGVLSPIHNDLTMALGSSEVSLLELTGAYAHLANQGKMLWTYGIKSIENKHGKPLFQRHLKAGGRQVISAQTVADMNIMLRSVVEYGTGKRAKLPVEAAGKTGTSQKSRDAWFIGYHSRYVVGVWVGKDDNASMDDISGGNLPAEIWRDVMLAITDNIENMESLPDSAYHVEHGKPEPSLLGRFLESLSISD